MVNVGQVLAMLCPGVEYSLVGEKYEDINWFGKEAPITKKQFTEGFAKYETWIAEQAETKAADKAVLLAKLGITAEEAQLLLS
jgi:hypothetical protein